MYKSKHLPHSCTPTGLHAKVMYRGRTQTGVTLSTPLRVLENGGVSECYTGNDNI